MYNGITELAITGICDSGTSVVWGSPNTYVALGAVANRSGVVFCAPEDATITKLGINLNTSTGTASRNLRFILADLNATGTYNSVLAATDDYAYNSGSLTYSSTGAMTYLDITKDGSGNAISSYNITKGSFYAILVERGATPGTWDASNTITVNLGTSAATLGTGNFFYSMSVPYGLSATTKQMGGIGIALSSTTAYGKGFGSHNSQTIATGTNTNYGLRFNLPNDFGDSVTLCGINFACAIAGGTVGNTIDIKLYEDNGNGTATLLYTHTNNENYQEPCNQHISWLFDQAQMLLTNKDYIIAINNNNATGNLDLHHFTYTDVKENTIFTAGYIPIRGVEVSSTGTITEIDKTYHINLLVEGFGMFGGMTATWGGMWNG